MSSQLVAPENEAEIWARLIESQPDDLTPETAKYFLRLGFTEGDHARMQDLADKSQSGTLTEGDVREFDSYLHVGNFLAVMRTFAV